jgi:hypothetical protein
MSKKDDAVAGAPEFIKGAELCELSFSERQELARLVRSPVFKKAWGNVMLGKPSVFSISGPETQGCDVARDVAVNKLYETRGWELFMAAFIRQIEGAPARKKSDTIEEWAASGQA